MIHHFEIDNFKSLVNFKLPELGQFVCLIGLNGAGKTTLLQSLDFVAQLSQGRIDDWLKAREWKPGDIVNHHSKKRTVRFSITFEFEVGTIVWKGQFNVDWRRCTEESFSLNGESLARLSNGRLVLPGDSSPDTPFTVAHLDYQGSVLSILRTDQLPRAEIDLLKEFLNGLKSLEMLSPDKMRQRARAADDLGTGGERLSGYLSKFTSQDIEVLSQSLKEFYPQVQAVKASASRGGWAKLRVTEQFEQNGQLETEARHMNDGMLRVLTILAQIQSGSQFLLFDEIENGINPELVEKLVQLLLKSPQQIAVTTHNPLILNYLPDDVARQSVILLFRRPNGNTDAVRFFDLPTPSKKLRVLGPGEVFVDTYLQEAAAEAAKPAAGAV